MNLEDVPFVVLKLEEDACDEGHSTLTIHGDAEIVVALAAATALMIAALAEEAGGSLVVPDEYTGDDEEIADAA